LNLALLQTKDEKQGPKENNIKTKIMEEKNNLSNESHVRVLMVKEEIKIDKKIS
jgi:hypothetical protein